MLNAEERRQLEELWANILRLKDYVDPRLMNRARSLICMCQTRMESIAPGVTTDDVCLGEPQP